MWAGLRTGTVTLSPDGGTTTITHTLVPLRAGRLPLPQLDAFAPQSSATAAASTATPFTTANATSLPGGTAVGVGGNASGLPTASAAAADGAGSGGAFVLLESAAPPATIFVSPLAGQLSPGLFTNTGRGNGGASSSVSAPP
jgi:hypothetical protein